MSETLKGKTAVKGSRVGKNFEKKIIRLLGQWWCNNPLSLYRTHGSGNRSTVLDDPKVYSGDVMPVSDAAKPWPFSIEIKKSEKFTLESILVSRKSEFYSFWKQCRRDAKRTGKIPLLIVGKNRYDPYIFYEYNIDGLLIEKSLNYGFMRVYPGGLGQTSIICMPLSVFLRVSKREWCAKWLTVV